jgi:flavin-dependent dehydrogenase
VRSLTIVGGGLGGLALGAALARAGVPVEICEAGRLPRHRVCGEFISGLRPEVIDRLSLAPHLLGAAKPVSTGWYLGGRLRFTAPLPEPALGLSRRLLEERLLDDFCAAGGKLRENTRVPFSDADGEPVGRVWTAGRRPDATSPWLGLKIHCRNFPLGQDLEIHLGRGGYVGATRVENGRVNICGLFRTRMEVRASRELLLVAYLHACGMGALAARVCAGEPDPASATAVSGLDFSRSWREQRRLSLGDHEGPIPPYTGHGMAMALESAALALEPLVAYACAKSEWAETAATVRACLATRHDARLRWARWLHPWLLHPAGQTLLVTLARARLLPFATIYRATHGRAGAAWSMQRAEVNRC